MRLETIQNGAFDELRVTFEDHGHGILDIKGYRMRRQHRQKDGYSAHRDFARSRDDATVILVREREALR